MERAEILDLVAKAAIKPPTPFIPGVTPVNYAGRVYDEAEIRAATDAVMDFYLTGGKYTHKFENDFSVNIGRKYTSLVNSGSSANLLALSALLSPLLGLSALKPGDEVITVAAGFPTTLNPIIQCGLIPVFVDISLDTLNIIPKKIVSAISARTRAIMIAHTLGNPFNINAIRKICDDYNLYLVSDNCDALGSVYDGERIEKVGDISTFSFYPAHHITSLPYDEMVWLRIEGVIRFMPIGEFVDNFPKYEGKAEAISFNKKGGLVFAPISSVIEHPCTESLYKITTQMGRTVTITSSHNIFSLEQGEIVSKKTSDYSVGDLILLPRVIPIGNKEENKIEFPNFKVGSWEQYDDALEVDELFAWFLGLFVAEGSFNSNKRNPYTCILSLHEKEVEWISRCERAIEHWGNPIRVYKAKNSKGINAVFNSKSLFLLLSSHCGRGAKNKKIPSFIFTASTHIKEAFLSGYFDGDGTVHSLCGGKKGTSIEAKTVSKELATGLFYLLMSLGISPRWSETAPTTRTFAIGPFPARTHAIRRTYMIAYSTTKKGLANSPGFRGKGGRSRFFGDMTQMKITKIEILPKQEKVYDLCVPGYENFIAGAGISVHNTGEGGCVSTDNQTLAKAIRSLGSWGRSCTCEPGRNNVCRHRFDGQYGNLPRGYDHKYVYSHIGYNLKATEVQAAILVAQLEKLPRFIERRKENYKTWQRMFIEKGITEYIDIVRPEDDSDPSWFAFPCVVRKDARFTRTDLTTYLAEHKVETRNLFGGNLIKQPAYRKINYKIIGKLVNTDIAMNNAFFLGVYPGMTREMIDYSTDLIAKFVKERG